MVGYELYVAIPMSRLHSDDAEVLRAYDAGKLRSVTTKAELAQFKAAARATALKDRRVNIRLSSADLMDIQARALADGLPYQTLIASVLHKYVSGRLTERDVAHEAESPSPEGHRSPGRPSR